MLISSVKVLFNFMNLTSFFLDFLIQELFHLNFINTKDSNLILNFG